MAEGVIKDIRTCLWNPDKDRRRESGERHGDKLMVAAHFISFDGDDHIEICKECAELAHFKNALKSPIVRTLTQLPGARHAATAGGAYKG